MSNSNISISVLFVCMGNICRSPAGEGIFRNYVEKSGYATQFRIDSAGTIAYHDGNPADARMKVTAAKRGYKLDSIARKVKPKDIESFDLIIAMDRENINDLYTIAGREKSHIYLLGAFLKKQPDNENATEVPDPYYGGGAGFETVLDMIESACPAILEHCLKLACKKNNGI